MANPIPVTPPTWEINPGSLSPRRVQLVNKFLAIAQSFISHVDPKPYKSSFESIRSRIAIVLSLSGNTQAAREVTDQISPKGGCYKIAAIAFEGRAFAKQDPEAARKRFDEAKLYLKDIQGASQTLGIAHIVLAQTDCGYLTEAGETEGARSLWGELQPTQETGKPIWGTFFCRSQVKQGFIQEACERAKKESMYLLGRIDITLVPEFLRKGPTKEAISLLKNLTISLLESLHHPNPQIAETMEIENILQLLKGIIRKPPYEHIISALAIAQVKTEKFDKAEELLDKLSNIDIKIYTGLKIAKGYAEKKDPGNTIRILEKVREQLPCADNKLKVRGWATVGKILASLDSHKQAAVKAFKAAEDAASMMNGFDKLRSLIGIAKTLEASNFGEEAEQIYQQILDQTAPLEGFHSKPDPWSNHHGIMASLLQLAELLVKKERFPGEELPIY